ncbi:hypothetical protein SRB17_25170 [Streptomyces sp. RB17]|nr:hypothetical protein [Streptomyces sp. RB17]
MRNIDPRRQPGNFARNERIVPTPGTPSPPDHPDLRPDHHHGAVQG